MSLFQVAFVLGMTLAVQLLLGEWGLWGPEQSVTPEARGDPLYHWQEDLHLTYSDFIYSAVYKQAVLPNSSWVSNCDDSALYIHKKAAISISDVHLFQVTFLLLKKLSVVSVNFFMLNL